MSDTERATSDEQATSSEIKRGVNELRQKILRLPDNPHKDNADRALDTVRDHAMKSLESPSDPNER